MDTMPRILTGENGKSIKKIDPANDPPETAGPVGARLRLFRKAVGYATAEQAGRAVDVAKSRWLNWEAGLALMPASVAVRIRRLHREMCLNWLFSGDTSTLTVEFAKLLERQAEIERNSPRNPRGCIRSVK